MGSEKAQIRTPKKKVLFVATVDSHILHFHIPYLKMFHDKGWEVHVATNGKEKIPYCDKKHTLPMERSPFSLKNLKAIKQMRKLVKDEHFDIIHCHTPMGSVVTRLAAKRVRKSGTRVIYTAHGFHFYKGAPLLNWMLFYPVEKYLAKYTDTLITINQEDYDRAKRKFSKRCWDIRYVPGVGVDPKKFDFKMSKEEKHDLRKSIGLKDEDFMMICVGRLDKNKNQGFLIKAMPETLKQRQNAHLILAGLDELNGKYQKIAQKLGIPNHVHFLGDRNDIPKLLKVSDVAVSASKREGLPVSLIEAAINGLPIVSAKTRGCVDIADRGAKILFYKSPNFPEAIRQITVSNKTIRNDMAFFYDKEILSLYDGIYFGKKNRSAAFIYDVRLKTMDGKNYYTDTNLDHKTLKMYSKYFEHLTMVTRKEKTKTVDNLGKCNTKNVTFDCVDSINLKKLINRELAKKVRSNIRNTDYAIIRMPSILGIIACHLCEKENKPYIVEMVGDPFAALWNYGKVTYKLAAPIIAAINKHYIKKAKNVIYVTNEYLQSKYPNHKNNIGISDVNIKNDNHKIIEDRAKRYLKAGCKDYTHKIGIIGSLNVEYKGHRCAIKAISELKKQGMQNIELHCLGQYTEKSKGKWLEFSDKNGVQGILHIDGTVPSGKPVNDWLDSMDFFIMPSQQEGLPRSLVEAMNRGLVCIGSTVGGIPELLKKGDTFKMRDFHKLSAMLKKYIDSPKECVVSSERNYAKSLEYKKELLDERKDEYFSNLLAIDPMENKSI